MIMISRLKRAGILIGGLLVVALSGLMLFMAFFVSYIDRHEVGFKFNRFTGEVTIFERTGYVLKTPFRDKVCAIDLRPYQVRITANLNIGDRILNAKLVRFNPEGLETFIEWHGLEAGNHRGNMVEILKCYVFAPDGGESCPFLEMVSEVAMEQGGFETGGGKDGRPDVRGNIGKKTGDERKDQPPVWSPTGGQ